MEFKPPQQIKILAGINSIFLAGTIDMDNSYNWQLAVKITLEKKFPHIDIYNPRRAEWDSSWDHNIETPEFYQQVNWELDALNKATKILMNFLPDSKSPITLLELGLFANCRRTNRHWFKLSNNIF